MTTTPGSPASSRVQLRRGAARGRYERDEVLAVLDAGLVAHLGVASDNGPVVIPMAYGHDGERLYLHGAVANAALGSGEGCDVCVTVTVVDGVIIGRSPFHNSMRYRSCVVRGSLERIDDPAEKRRALQLVSDHVVDTWATGREPSGNEIRRTIVTSLALTEASVKVRAGDPTDEPDDLATDYWAGAVPVVATWGPLEPSADLRAEVAAPAAVQNLVGAAVSPVVPKR